MLYFFAEDSILLALEIVNYFSLQIGHNLMAWPINDTRNYLTETVQFLAY